MASFLKKTMLYLGLGPDEDYEAYDDAPEPERERREATARSGVRPTATHEASSSVRPIRPGPPGQHPGDQDSGGAPRDVEAGEERHSTRGSTSVVRPLPRLSHAKPHTIAPGSFNDVQEVADRFKSSQPVIVNLEGADRDLRRRLIDFCSGLCYGLGGQMERVADNVYLLTPSNVEVSAEDRRRLERGLER